MAAPCPLHQSFLSSLSYCAFRVSEDSETGTHQRRRLHFPLVSEVNDMIPEPFEIKAVTLLSSGSKTEQDCNVEVLRLGVFIVSSC